MTDYEKLVRALRCNGLSKECDSCGYGYRYCPDSECNDACHVERIINDAADAIVALGLDNEDYEHENRRLHGEIEALQAEQKKTVTQIFGEEQMAWEGRCKDLMKHISDLQAEIRESMQKCAECGDEQEQKAKELQARLGEAENSAERWKDMYLTKLAEALRSHLLSVPLSLLNDAADAIEALQDTVQAQDKALKECARQLAKMGPKRGEWIDSKERMRPDMCSACGCIYEADRFMDKIAWHYCPNCGAKMIGEQNVE